MPESHPGVNPILTYPPTTHAQAEQQGIVPRTADGSPAATYTTARTLAQNLTPAQFRRYIHGKLSPNTLKKALKTPASFALDNPDITFSVVGEHAANWDKIKHRAFRGRDDGKLRVELDASGAKIKGFPKAYPVYDVMHKLLDAGVYYSEEYTVYSALRFVEDMTVDEKGEKKLNETDLKEDVNSPPDLAAEVEHGLKAAGLTWQSDIQAVRGACFTALSKWKKKLEEELKGLNIEKPSGEAWHALVEQKPGLASVDSGKRIVSSWSGKWLDDVLDFPELFEAYPQLRNIQLAEDFGLALASASYSEFARVHDVSIGKNEEQYPLGFINMNPTASAWSDERKATSLLLHEIQHAIQDIEGFAKGANARNGMDAYMRSAGEIEARNVEKRMAWRAARREATPFNNTLEYPGEALVSFSIQSIMTDWSAELDNFVQNPPVHNSKQWKNDNVYVCPTPAVMQMVGALPLDMVMSHHVLTKVLDKKITLGNGKTIEQMYGSVADDVGKHEMTISELRKLPIALANPVCIAESNRKSSLEVITDMEENGVNVLVAVRLNVASGSNPKLVVNRITSLYGKGKIDKLVQHPMLYVNTAKAHRWMVVRGLQLPTKTKLSAGSTGRILTPEDLVKYKMEKRLSFALEPYTPAELAEGFLRRQNNGHRLLRRMAAYMRNQARRYRFLYPRMPKDTQAALQAIADAQALILYSLRLYIPYKFFKRRESVWQGHFLQSLNHGKQIPPAIFLFFSLPRQP